MRLYPNPATTVVNFDLQNNVKGYSIQIFSFMGGKKMFEQKLTTDHTAVNLSSFTRGVYIFQLRNEEGRIVESGKFQVSRWFTQAIAYTTQLFSTNLLAGSKCHPAAAKGC